MKKVGTPASGGKIGRRTVLKGAAATAATAVMGFPHISLAQNKPIRIGMNSILSGRFAMLGASSTHGVQLEVDKFNAAGGLNGRPIELIIRDSKGKPEEATRLVREFINSDGCEVVLDADSSASAFAVQEAVKNLGILTVHTNSETTSLTADPKNRSWNTFRSCRQGILDSIASGAYAANIAKAKGLNKWMGCSPDYAYGRDSNELFFRYLKRFHKDAEVIGESWPKLAQPDYTEQLTKILQTKPQAIYSCLWGGDLTAFIDQASIYNLFAQMEVFAANIADYAILTAIKNLPKGIHSGSRYLSTFPPTKANADWSAAYHKKFNNEYPLNWSWENACGINFVIEAMKKTNSTDSKKLAEAMAGMTIDSPFGANGKLTMRAEDHTLIDYAMGWGQSIQKFPFVPDVKPGDWKVILELEKEWKKENGFI
ncbi:MAG: ABC transporter substrate-binding protein [Hyphomicrobiaceae bacterium]